jgi:hypothetical protein
MNTKSGADYYADDDVVQVQGTAPQRRSRLFCGVLDFRTATVVLNVMHIFFAIFLAFVLMIMFLIEGGPFLFKNIASTFGTAVVAVGISMAGLHGAMNWNLSWLYAACAGWCILIIWRVWTRDWLDLVVAIVLLYPHVMLTHEIRSGVLTIETFEEEEYVADGGKEFVQIAHGYVVTSYGGSGGPSAMA